MKSRWSQADAESFVSTYGEAYGEALALRTYTSRLLGADPSLVLHGGGNTSLKSGARDWSGRKIPALLVKASGKDLAHVQPGDHVAIELEALRRIVEAQEQAVSSAGTAAAESPGFAGSTVARTERLAESGTVLAESPGFPGSAGSLPSLESSRSVGSSASLRPAESSTSMESCLSAESPASRAAFELRLRAAMRRLCFDPEAGAPSIEAPVHAVLPGAYVDHTHADAVLALTNREDGLSCVRAALAAELDGELIVIGYFEPGFSLAAAVAHACRDNPRARAMVLMHHGLITWGDSARESYELTISLVSRAERELESAARVHIAMPPLPSTETLERRAALVAPIVRGMLATPSGSPDRRYRRVVLECLRSPEALRVIECEQGRDLCVAAPLTGDHLIRVGILPAWVERPDYEDEDKLRAAIDAALAAYAQSYTAYLARHSHRMPEGVAPFAAKPKVVFMPGLGALCCGDDPSSARIARDISEHALAVRLAVASCGASYRTVGGAELFDMEYRVEQHAKLALPPASAVEFSAEVALISGAAGAIGSGICERLLGAGINVAASDLPGPALDDLVEVLERRFPGKIVSLPLDVGDQQSVAQGFDTVAAIWGGVDFVIINAGLAHVSSLAEMEIGEFQRLQRVNTEGTLLLLREAGRHFRRQRSGGDIVLVSTKNVFAPGPGFGAYSATKAAAHQLARIASQEFAADDVRVNMVAPDAVFSHGKRASGLWAEVGPERMRARGLDPEGLEEYYRNRNLLKVGISAEHVAEAVLFFLSRLTPTTGATLPVDGGLPDSTPR